MHSTFPPHIASQLRFLNSNARLAIESSPPGTTIVLQSFKAFPKISLLCVVENAVSRSGQDEDDDQPCGYGEVDQDLCKPTSCLTHIYWGGHGSPSKQLTELRLWYFSTFGEDLTPSPSLPVLQILWWEESEARVGDMF